METGDKTTLRTSMERAIENGHIWPAFQPIVDLRTGAIAGFEVLARWTDPDVGEISPLVFIPHMEQEGLSDTIMSALIDRACRTAATWPGPFSIAFNISPPQLAKDSFPRWLTDTVEKTRFPLDRVELEVTEGSLISDVDQTYRIMRDVNDRGVRIGIDDFGTGYSNLARLESFPFHKLKIDARFVHGLEGEPSKRRIVAATIGLAHSLGIIVVAEGIETATEETILQKLGCDLGQGWLYGKGNQAEEAQGQLEMRGSADSAGRPLDASPFLQFHQLASLYDHAPAGLCFVDTDFRHVRVNDHFAGIHGMTRVEIEGQTVHDILEAEQLQAVLKVLAEAAAVDGPITLDYVTPAHDFRIIATSVRDFAGKLLGFSIVTTMSPAKMD